MNRFFFRLLWSGCFTTVTAASVFAGDPATATDKGSYTLFHPVPASLLREFSTDRPDRTEGPTTVDAGHAQVEMDFVTYSLDRRDGVQNTTWNAAPFNVRLGLTEHTEFDFIYDSYVSQEEREPGTRRRETVSGAGDVTLRIKANFWGNEGGSTAFGVIPFVKLPTHSTSGLGNSAIEGGLILPLMVQLPGDFELGLMTEFDFTRDEEGHGYHPEFVNSITVSHKLIGELNGYVEFYSSVSRERHAEWEGTVDAGLTFAVRQNVQLDGGCNVGVTGAADDVNPFIGLSVRF